MTSSPLSMRSARYSSLKDLRMNCVFLVSSLREIPPLPAAA